MEKRNLTGNWYLKKTLFGNYKVMVEVKKTYIDENDFSFSPSYTMYEKATNVDIILLGINVI